MKNIFIKALSILILLVIYSVAVKAQLNPLGASYFQNQYLTNPAMAGLNEGMDINLTYRKQWSSVPGSPTDQALTGQYGFGSKVGLGLTVTNNKAGLQKWTRAVATYAYHLPLNNDGDKLNLGLSVGFSSERLDMSAVTGDNSDVAIGEYNQRDMHVDGDFGAAYTTGKLTIQAAIPNLKNFLNKDNKLGTADRSTFFAAASYKMQFGDAQGFGIEPKVSYRNITDLENIVDAGANFTFINNKLNLLAIYHSTRHTTFGVGMQYQNLNISGMFTNDNSALSSNTNGTFDINLGINLYKVSGK